MKRVHVHVVVALAMFGGCFAEQAMAQQGTRIARERDWDAYTTADSRGNKICYAISVPKDTNPKNVNRGDIYITVTQRPRIGAEDEINIIVGYPIRTDSEVTASIGGNRFRLFTEGDGAWLRTRREDSEMVAAMQRGNSMVVRGTSQRGTNTTDRYSLMGFTAAHQAATRACAN